MGNTLQAGTGAPEEHSLAGYFAEDYRHDRSHDGYVRIRVDNTFPSHP